MQLLLQRNRGLGGERDWCVFLGGRWDWRVLLAWHVSLSSWAGHSTHPSLHVLWPCLGYFSSFLGLQLSPKLSLFLF